MHAGYIVLWNGALHIVQAHCDIKGKESATLLPFNMSNVSIHVTMNWPDKEVYTCDCENEDDHTEDCPTRRVVDKTKTYDTIKVVARCMSDWLHNQLDSLLGLQRRIGG